MISCLAIIGSFRKYYDKVVELIAYFNNNGVAVTSPSKSRITELRAKFVIFESDNSKYSDEDIQTITLEKILRADAVYVHNPKGYIGKTTSYEIGVCLSKKKPIYYLERPDDLPVPVNNDQIVSPEEMLQIATNNSFLFYEEYNLCDHAQKAFSEMFGKSRIKNKRNNLLICGSMTFYEKMLICKNELSRYGLDVIIPEDESDFFELLTAEEANEFKRKVSRSYLKKIRSSDTTGILVFNESKKGINNYIGANTLAEIVMAFSWNRKIYLLNDIYEPLSDELTAWGCIPLRKDLSKIYNDIDLLKVKSQDSMNGKQLSLF